MGVPEIGGNSPIQDVKTSNLPEKLAETSMTKAYRNYMNKFPSETIMTQNENKTVQLTFVMGEHQVKAILPFSKFAGPNAKIISLLKLPAEKLQKLSSDLVKTIAQKTANVIGKSLQ